MRFKYVPDLLYTIMILIFISIIFTITARYHSKFNSVISTHETMIQLELEQINIRISDIERKVDDLSGINNRVYDNVIALVPELADDVDIAYQYTDAIIYYADQYEEIDYSLLLALIWVESRYNEEAISHAGARGPAQIMPFWAGKFDIEVDDLHDLETNLELSCMILDYYYDHTSSDLTEEERMKRALCRYSGSCSRCETCAYTRRLLRLRSQIERGTP